jgi:CRISPR-associated endoribonuclease Cas6
MLAFSPLLFRERVSGNHEIRLVGDAGHLLIASPLDNILEAASNWSGVVEIAGNLADIGKKGVVEPPAFEERMVWETLPGSGICTRAKTGEKWKYVSAPDPECINSLRGSLMAKWKTLCDRNPTKAIRWCESEDPKKWGLENLPQLRIAEHQNAAFTPIKQHAFLLYWPGKVEVTGHTAWQRLIWDCGLGSKTGLGVGMVELRREARRCS